MRLSLLLMGLAVVSTVATTNTATVQRPLFQDNLGKPVPEMDLNGARDGGVWDAVASAGPYANNLHVAADR